MSDQIPHGWEHRPLGEFIHAINERNGGHQNIPVLSVTKYDGFVSSLEYFKKQVFSKDISGYKKVTRGDFAYSTIHLDEGALGLLENWDVGLISPMYTVFRTNELLVSKFLFYLLKSAEYMNKYPALGQGSINRRASIPFSALARLHIRYPPLSEQHKITTILTSVDEVIEKTESQINKLQDLKKGMMQELLTKGIGHTEFKDSPVGRIPQTWNVMSCDEVCKQIVVGIVVRPTQYYSLSGIPALRSANVREEGLNNNNLKYITAESNELLVKSKVMQGDILTVRTGYPGTSAVVTEVHAGCNCVDLIISRPKSIINSDYLCYWINSDYGKGQVLKTQGGLAQQHFNVGDMKKLLVALPSAYEQAEIASVLMSAERNIFLRSHRLTQLQCVKKALMQDLLTGKVRVTVN